MDESADYATRCDRYLERCAGALALTDSSLSAHVRRQLMLVALVRATVEAAKQLELERGELCDVVRARWGRDDENKN